MVSMARAGLAFFGLEYQSETTPHPIDTIQPTHRPNRERGPDWLSSDWNTNPRPHHTPSTPSSRPTDQIGSAGRIGFLRIGIPIRDHTTPHRHHPADPPTK